MGNISSSNKNLKILENVKKQMIKTESVYNKNATLNKAAVRLKEEDLDIRLDFARDVDKILHSLSFTRYIDKTQVFSNSEDHQISKRITHVQYVSRAARTIARALGLNEDLCEAIALGHDIGHVPFGHVGEQCLDEISRRELGEIFAHNVQSVRNYMYLEKNGKGVNLTVQTLDGMLCHNGEIVSNEYKPVKKDKDIFLKEFKECYDSEEVLKNLRPMTLEGCVVRLADIVGYIGKDIEDAIMVKKISRDDIPFHITELLGNNNVEIMNNLILDIIVNSYNKGYISMSLEVFKALKDLQRFNYENIYKKAMDEDEVKHVKNMFNELFDFYLDKLEKDGTDSDIYTVFLNNMSEKYINENSNKRKVIDYLSKLTDGYLRQVYNKNIEVR